MVGLGGKERALGEAAKSKIASNIVNTVVEIKRLIGRKWDLWFNNLLLSEGADGGKQVCWDRS